MDEMDVDEIDGCMRWMRWKDEMDGWMRWMGV